jgi:hypothetical protein
LEATTFAAFAKKALTTRLKRKWRALVALRRQCSTVLWSFLRCFVTVRIRYAKDIEAALDALFAVPKLFVNLVILPSVSLWFPFRFPFVSNRLKNHKNL